jgi:hypothetical protein
MPKPSPANPCFASRLTLARAAKLDARREDELAAGEPRRGVGKLGDVHPPNRRARGPLARREREPRVPHEAAHRRAGLDCGGSGHQEIKLASVERFRERAAELLAQLRSAEATAPVASER